MVSVCIDASRISFPQTCPHCGQPPDTTRTIRADRTRRSVYSTYVRPAPFDVPVCRRCARRRTWLGVVVVIANILFVIVGALVATALALNDRTIAAALLGAAVLTVGLMARMGWDEALLDSAVLGIRARAVKGPGKRLRITIGRDDYFSKWAALNPSMTAIRRGTSGGTTEPRR